MKKIEQIISHERSIRISARQARMRKLRRSYASVHRIVSQFRSGTRHAAQFYRNIGNIARSNRHLRPECLDRILANDRHRLPRVLRFGKPV